MVLELVNDADAVLVVVRQGGLHTSSCAGVLGQLCLCRIGS